MRQCQTDRCRQRLRALRFQSGSLRPAVPDLFRQDSMRNAAQLRSVLPMFRQSLSHRTCRPTLCRPVCAVASPYGRRSTAALGLSFAICKIEGGDTHAGHVCHVRRAAERLETNRSAAFALNSTREAENAIHGPACLSDVGRSAFRWATEDLISTRSAHLVNTFN